MSIGTIETIIERIKAATTESRIAVYKTRDGLEAVFADTVDGLSRIKADRNFVGVYHNKFDLKKIREKLLAELD